MRISGKQTRQSKADAHPDSVPLSLVSAADDCLVLSSSADGPQSQPYYGTKSSRHVTLDIYKNWGGDNSDEPPYWGF